MYFWFWKYIVSHKGKLFNEQSLYFWQDIKQAEFMWFLGGGQEKALKLPT